MIVNFSHSLRSALENIWSLKLRKSLTKIKWWYYIFVVLIHSWGKTAGLAMLGVTWHSWRIVNSSPLLYGSLTCGPISLLRRDSLCGHCGLWSFPNNKRQNRSIDRSMQSDVTIWSANQNFIQKQIVSLGYRSKNQSTYMPQSLLSKYSNTSTRDIKV